MARYCVAFQSMQSFLGLRGTEGLEELVGVISQCQEFADVHLRMSEKRVLNTLNKDKNRATIRYGLPVRYIHTYTCSSILHTHTMPVLI